MMGGGLLLWLVIGVVVYLLLSKRGGTGGCCGGRGHDWHEPPENRRNRSGDSAGRNSDIIDIKPGDYHIR